MTKQKYFNSAV